MRSILRAREEKKNLSPFIDHPRSGESNKKKKSELNTFFFCFYASNLDYNGGTNYGYDLTKNPLGGVGIGWGVFDGEETYSTHRSRTPGEEEEVSSKKKFWEVSVVKNWCESRLCGRHPY